MTDKSENAYKTIGEVAEILKLRSKKKEFSQHIPSGFGNHNLNRLNLNY